MIVFNPKVLLDNQISDPKNCVLIDEADYILFDCAATLQNLTVYGLSATVT